MNATLAASQPPNYRMLMLLPLPVTCICGNALVRQLIAQSGAGRW